MPTEPGADPLQTLFERPASAPAEPLAPRVTPRPRPSRAPRSNRPALRTALKRPDAAGPSRLAASPRTRLASVGASPAARHRLPRALAFLLSVVMIGLSSGLGAYGVATSGFFDLRAVEVRGADLVSPLDVSAATGVIGRNLLQVDPAVVRQRVEQLPGVKRAEARRVFPRGLVVTITERTPVAVWQMGGAGYAVDEEGVVLDTAPDPALPAVYRSDSVDGLTAGDRVDADAVKLAVRLRSVGPSPAGQRITRLEWSQRAGMEAVTDQGVRVRLGDGSALDFKLDVWRSVIEQARKEKALVREIDLRFGDRVVYR